MTATILSFSCFFFFLLLFFHRFLDPPRRSKKIGVVNRLTLSSSLSFSLSHERRTPSDTVWWTYVRLIVLVSVSGSRRQAARLLDADPVPISQSSSESPSTPWKSHNKSNTTMSKSVRRRLTAVQLRHHSSTAFRVFRTPGLAVLYRRKPTARNTPNVVANLTFRAQISHTHSVKEVVRVVRPREEALKQVIPAFLRSIRKLD